MIGGSPEAVVRAVAEATGPVVFGPSGASALAFFDLHGSPALPEEWVVTANAPRSRDRGCAVRRLSRRRSEAWVDERLGPVEVAMLMVMEPGTWEMRSEPHEDAVARLALQIRLGRARPAALLRAARSGPSIVEARLREVVAAAGADA